MKDRYITMSQQDQYTFATVKQYAFKEINSTQTWTAAHLEIIPNNGWLAVTADMQTEGLGTRGKRWHSPNGNLYATLSTRLPKISSWSSLLTGKEIQIPQIAALSVVETLEYFGVSPAIKWVNDVMLNNKKIGGVLTEIRTSAYGKILLVGIGLNVNMSKHEATKACPKQAIKATSLFIETNKKHDLKEIFEKIQQSFYENIHSYFKNAKTPIIEIEKRLTCKKGDLITLQQENNKTLLCGIFLGLSENGFIRIKQKNGNMLELRSGKLISPLY